AGGDRGRSRGEDPHRSLPYLVAASPHRRPGDRFGRAGCGVAEDGDLRVRAHRHADAPGGVAVLGLGDHGDRYRLGAVRSVRGAGPDGPQADGRLHLRQPYGLHRPGPGCGGSGRRGCRAGPLGGGHRCGGADGQPRVDHRRAVPAGGGAAGSGPHPCHGVLRRAGRARAEGAEQARSVAVTGAVVQMVSHGLITAALFLLAGVMQDRAGTYDMGSYGGLAGPAPRYAALFAVGAFASLGLPGFSGFIAEFQIFAGSIAVAPVTAIALPGILVTAALFLRALQQVFTGPTEGRSPGFADLRVRELWSVGPLLALSVLIGVLPRVLLEVIEPASAALVSLVGR